MPFQGRAFDKAIEIRTRCRADFPIDLMVRSPQEVEQRYQWGDPFIREAIDQGTPAWLSGILSLKSGRERFG